MKELTLNAVRTAANLLIEANDQTTTLEVKTLLRQLDYKANQSEVSELMSELTMMNEFDFEVNGVHRVYTLVDSDIEDDEEDEEEIGGDYMVLNSCVDGMSKTALNREFDADDMVLYDVDATTPTAVYNGAYNRNDMKTHYSKTHGISYLDVRLRMVKNMK